MLVAILIGILLFYVIKRRFDYLELRENQKEHSQHYVSQVTSKPLNTAVQKSYTYTGFSAIPTDEECLSREGNLLRVVRSPVVSIKMNDVEIMKLRFCGRMKFYANSIEPNELGYIRLVDENENSICVLGFIGNKHSTNPALNMKMQEICTDWDGKHMIR